MRSLAFATAALCVLLATGRAGAALQVERTWSVALPESNVPRLALDAAGHVVSAFIPYDTAQRCLRLVKRAATSGQALWQRDICRDVPAHPEGTPPPSSDFAVESTGGHVVVAAYFGFLRYVALLDGADGASTWEHTAAANALAIPQDRIRVAIAPDGELRLLSSEAGATRVQALRRADGSTRWVRDVGPASGGPGVSLAVAPAGFTVVSNGVDALLRLDAFGSVDWNVPTGGSPSADLFAIDNQGNPVLQVFSSATALLRKFSAADGGLLWEKAAMLSGLAVDTGDNVIGSVRSGDVFNSHVTKWRPDGVVDWEHALVSPEGEGLAAGRIETDVAGNPIVYVTASGVAGGPSRFRLRKLASRGGHVLWDYASGELVGAQAIHAHDFRATSRGIAIHYFNTLGTPPGLARFVEHGFASPVDFDRNATADVAVRASDGRALLWLMRAGRIESSTALIGPATGWSATHSGDFDGDGHADLLWQHADGRVAMWLMKGASQAGGAGLIGPGTGWQVRLVADFDGDGDSDIVWRHADGRTAMWLMDGARQAGGAGLIGAGTGWNAIHAADFDADGRADLLWEHADGRSAMWIMAGARQAGGTGLLAAGTGWRAKLASDYDGDGRADLVWYQDDGRIAIWFMDGSRLRAAELVATAAAEGRLVLAGGDLDGDGRKDVLTLRGGVLHALLREPAGAMPTVAILDGGAGFSVSRVADFDDDAAAEILLSRSDGSIELLKLTRMLGRRATLAPGGSGLAATPFDD